MGITSPCFECRDRHVGCHADCERYKADKERRNALKTEYIRKEEPRKLLNDMRQKTVDKAVRKKNKKK